MKREIKSTEFHNGKQTDGLWEAEKVGKGLRGKWVSRREITIEYDDEAEYIVLRREWMFPGGFRELSVEWTPDEYLNVDPSDQTVKRVIYPDSDAVWEVVPDVVEYRDYAGHVKETGEDMIIHCSVRYRTYDIGDPGERVAQGVYIQHQPDKKVQSPVWFLNDEYGVCRLRSLQGVTKLVLDAEK